MMKGRTGAFNSAGFTAGVSKGSVPSSAHITYEGVFNQLEFELDEPTKQIFDLSYFSASAVNPVTKELERFIGCLTTGCDDGQPRDERPLLLTIVLDISGSMSGSRLSLAKQAISLLVQKLRFEDMLGVVLFNNQASLLLPMTRAQDIDKAKFADSLAAVNSAGGTTLRSGFDMALNCQMPLKQLFGEKRIVMLTDVEDNSLLNEQGLIAKVSQAKVNTTIIGIGESFKAHVCEQLNHIRGFNYFCAASPKDLSKFLVEQFDFTFFPSIYDTRIVLFSQSVEEVEVFGTTVEPGPEDVVKPSHAFTISTSRSCFPSPLRLEKDKAIMEGGLILIRLKLRPETTRVSGEFRLSFTKRDDLSQQHRKIPLDYELGDAQLFGHVRMRQAIESFYFVNVVKQSLQRLQKLNLEDKEERAGIVLRLRELEQRTENPKLKEQLGKLLLNIQERQ